MSEHLGKSRRPAPGTDKTLTNRQGHPGSDDQSQRTVGSRGPATLEKYQSLEKLSHFAHERIPAGRTCTALRLLLGIGHRSCPTQNSIVWTRSRHAVTQHGTGDAYNPRSILPDHRGLLLDDRRCGSAKPNRPFVRRALRRDEGRGCPHQRQRRSVEESLVAARTRPGSGSD